MKLSDINIKSEEVQEILGTPPKSIVRWGITVVFLILLMLVGMSYLIEYPDIVKGKAILTTEKPPIKVSSFANGYLEQIFISDQDSVQKGSKIALIESTAKYQDVLEVQSFVLELDSAKKISNINFNNKRKSLGEIQNEYNNFISSFNELQFFYTNNLEAENNKNINNQLLQVKKQYQKLINQKDLQKLEMVLLDKQIDKRAKLYKQDVISKEEYENFKVSYYQKKQQYESYKISLSNNEITQTNLEKEISGNSFSRVYKDNQIVMKFEESKDILMSKINWWKKKYLIISPIAGKISFGKIWSENQKVTQGEELFTIVPESNELIAKIYVPLLGIGKLKKEQKILINLSSFPAQEFGYLECKVDKISLISDADNLYIVEADIADTIKTSYKKEILFIPQMEGTASIITRKKKIISRVFEQFNKLFDFNQ